MKRSDWLLLIIGERIEPIQLQKALFKFAMESGAPKTEKYQFVPYNWGPCSFRIYSDLAGLRSEGLIETVPSGRGWGVYRVTEKGIAKVHELRKKANPKVLAQLKAARDYVVSRDFEILLRDIYSDYPAYARESLFKS